MEENKLYIEPSIADNLPSAVVSQLAAMPADKQALFVEEYERRKKSVGMAYFFLLICFGAPYGYLGKWGWQIVYWITGFGAFLWFLILLFSLPSQVHDYNRDVAMDIMKDLRIMGLGDGNRSESRSEEYASGSTVQSSSYAQKSGNDVCSFSVEKINEILANEAIYNPKLVAACREELEIRSESEKFAEFADSKTDDELREIIKNADQYNPAMVRRCSDVMNARIAKAEEEERQRQEKERLRLEEEERQRLAKEEEERLAEEKRQAELWAKWRIPVFVLIAVIAVAVVGYVVHLNIESKARQEQIRIEAENARIAEEQRLEEERLAAEDRAKAERLEKERIAQSKAAEAERLKEEKRISEEKAEAERLEKERVAAEERAARLAAEEKEREAWKQQILAKHKSGEYRIGEPMPEITGYATVPVIFNVSNFIECFVVIDDKCSLKDVRKNLDKCPDSFQARTIGLEIATINANLLKLGYNTIGYSYWVNISSNNSKYVYAYNSHTQKVVPFSKDNDVNTCLQVIKYDKQRHIVYEL